MSLLSVQETKETVFKARAKMVTAQRQMVER